MIVLRASSMAIMLYMKPNSGSRSRIAPPAASGRLLGAVFTECEARAKGRSKNQAEKQTRDLKNRELRTEN